jgi:hypothetical protein
MDDHARILLAQSLSLVALIGVTIEYAEIAKRRAMQRIIQSEIAAAQEIALRGLVRTLLVDEN